MATRPFRIGAGAGYSGDRIDPARDLAERGFLEKQESLFSASIHLLKY